MYGGKTQRKALDIYKPNKKYTPSSLEQAISFTDFLFFKSTDDSGIK